MKKPLLLLAALTLVLPARAQVFNSDSLGTAAIGGLLGGIIGHNSGRRTAEGIGIGAGTGLLLGALRNNHRNRGGYDSYIPSRSQSVYASGGRVERRPNYAVTGAALGGLAGGIIGHNNGRKTAEGIGIGAVSGLVLGGLAENAARRSERRHYYAHEARPVMNSTFYSNPRVVRTPVVQPVVTRTVTPTAVISSSQSPAAGSTLVTRVTNPPVQQTTTASGLRQMRTGRSGTATKGINAQTVIINNYYGSGQNMSGANSMFGR